MGFAKIQGNLTSRKRCRVRFGAPKDVSERGGKAAFGTIIDEVWADPEINMAPPHTQPCDKGAECWGDYSFSSQLIEWDDGWHSIRLGYHRRRCGENCWEYAAQTTVNAECETIKALLQRTLAMTTWFQAVPAGTS